MKKFFYVFLSCVMLCMLAACGPGNNPEQVPEYLDKTKTSTMEVYLGFMPIKNDTTINVTVAEEDAFTGTPIMGIKGKITGVEGFRITATRSEEGQTDELCAGVQCVPGDGKFSQNFDYELVGGATEASWYTHYSPAKEGVYTIAYKFQNYNRTLTLTVNYDYKAE